MPSKKRKYNARFPAGRIKKIMRIDDEIGKVAMPVPVMISRALELFVSSLLRQAGDITLQKRARTLTLAHLKQCIYSDDRLSFLKELVKNIPDLPEESNDNFEEPIVMKQLQIKKNNTDEKMCSVDQQRGNVSEDQMTEMLKAGCLCGISADACGQLFPAKPASRPADAIVHMSVLRLMFVVRRQQADKISPCPTIARACSTLLSDRQWIDRLLDVLKSADKYTKFVTACVVSEVASCCDVTTETQNYIIDELVQSVIAAIRGPSYVPVLDVFTRVLYTVHSSRESAATVGPPCRGNGDDDEIETRRSAVVAKRRDAKSTLLNRLNDRWPCVVRAAVGTEGHGRSVEDIGGDTTAAIALVRLWKAILFASSQCRRRHRYYSCLPELQHLLYRTDTCPLLWLNTVGLFGAGLSGPYEQDWLEEDEEEEEASQLGRRILAGGIVTGVTEWRLLYYMDRMSDGYASRGNDVTRVAQETVVLVMRSLRVVTDVNGVGGDAETVKNVVDCLDSYVKSRTMYDADVRFSRWMVRLLCDRDDAVVECLMCAMYVARAVPDAGPLLDPFESFVEYLSCVRYDEDVLVDFLMSNENDFLTYALKILKMVAHDCDRFFRTCGDRLENTMELLIRLRFKLLRLYEQDVFPYNIRPIAKLIQRCDELYSEYL